MNNLPDPREWYATIVTTLRKHVFSKNFVFLLIYAGRNLRGTPDMGLAISRARNLLEPMRLDGDLRFWLNEHAAIPEAIATTDMQQFEALARRLQADCSLVSVAKIGLEMMEPLG